MRVEKEPRLESRLRWPVGEVTDEEVVVVVEEEEGGEEVVVVVVGELKSSCLLPKEPLEDNRVGHKQVKPRTECEPDVSYGAEQFSWMV